MSETGKVISKGSNIFGFTKLNDGDRSPSNYKPVIYNNISSTPSKNGGTTNGNKDPGRILNDGVASSSKGSINSTDYNKVRNAWLNKFSNSNSGVKRSRSLEDEPSKPKIPKTTNSNLDTNKVNCPICNKSYNINDLNNHLDKCLEETNTTKDCIICGKEVARDMYESHVTKCSSETFDNDFELTEVKETSDSEHEVDELRLCEVCSEMVATDDYETHIGECLHRMYDDLEDKYSNKTVSCVACSKIVPKEDLNNHLENCPSLSSIFDDDNEPLEGQQL